MLAPILQSHRPVPTKSGETLSAALKSRSWCAYLIISTRPPIKTYVGVTTDFSRRLKQHNGEIKGGAKASRAGRPWVCACIIHGFKDQSEACAFETKWKSVSKRLPYRRKKLGSEGEELDDISLQLLQRRHQALGKVEEFWFMDSWSPSELPPTLSTPGGISRPKPPNLPSPSCYLLPSFPSISLVKDQMYSFPVE